jgi:WD40 repeat protein
VYHVLFHPSGDFLMSGDLKGVIKQWDVASGTVARELAAPSLYKYDKVFHADIGGTRGMAFSADAKLFAASGMTEVTNAFAGIGLPEVVSFDWETGKPARQHRPKEPTNAVACGVRFHRDGYWMAAAGGPSGGCLYFWKPDAAQEFFKFPLPNTAIDFDLHPDGLQLAVAHFSGHLRIYSLAAKAKA